MKNLLIILFVGVIAIGCDESTVKKTHFPNGAVESEITYVDGLKNGSFIYYNDRGEKWKEGVFKNDSLDGLLVIYSSNGKDTSKTSFYNEGELLETTDFDGASVKIKSDYKNKLTTIYDKSGAVDTVIQMK